MLMVVLCCLASVVVAAPAGASSDPLWPSQWALTQIGAPQAWTRTIGAGIRIGVVDTGVDANHEDLAGKVVASTSCVGSRGESGACAGSGQDDHGHGTHVSAIATAATNNNKGIAGVAPGAQLLVAKALVSNNGSVPAGSVADLNAGIRWVVDRGARVVNLSVGGDWSRIEPGGHALSEGIAYAWNHGTVPVLAAGNDPLGLGGQGPDYRGLDAVVVGANDRNGNLASYSSRLDTARWGIVAPGGAGGDPAQRDAYAAANVVSAWSSGHTPSGYAVGAGTSMAAAHVSGGLALLLARGMGQEAAVQQILSTANTSVACGSGCHGRLDLGRATGAPTPAAVAQLSRSVPREATSEPKRAPTRTVNVRLTPPDPGPPMPTALPVDGNQLSVGEDDVAIPRPTSSPAPSLPGRPLSDTTGSGLPIPGVVVTLAVSAVGAGQLIARKRLRRGASMKRG